MLEEYVEGSEKLYFIFGGVVAGVGMPPFEFCRSSKIVNENRIFLRDASQSWYQNGLFGIGNDIYSVIRFVESKIEQLSPREIFLVGNSMGGYAAILVAAALGKGKVICFAPQTFISLSGKLANLDWRWCRKIVSTYFGSFGKDHVWDVRPLVARCGGRVRIDIFVSSRDRLDCAHAARLREFEQVSIHEFVSGGHGVVRYLRDAGLLPEILRGGYSGGGCACG